MKAYRLIPSDQKLIGWTENKLDRGYSHYTSINNNLFFDGFMKETQSVSDILTHHHHNHHHTIE